VTSRRRRRKPSGGGDHRFLSSDHRPPEILPRVLVFPERYYSPRQSGHG
jgi:hypothetical protein